MEQPSYINNSETNNADASLYNQRQVESSTSNTNKQSQNMRVFFSGYGKAPKDMGIAPIPPLWIPGPPAWN